MQDSAPPQSPQVLHPSDVAAHPELTADKLQDIVEVYPNTAWRPFPWTLVAVGLAGILIILIGVWGYRRWRRRPKQERPKTPAERLSDALRTLETIDAQDAQAFYTQLRNVLNSYFEIKWGHPADSFSPEELLVELDIEEATRTDRPVLQALIKRYMTCVFAGVVPSIAERNGDLKNLKDISQR